MVWKVLKALYKVAPNITNPKIHPWQTVHLIILIYSLFWKCLFWEKSHLKAIPVCK